MSATTPLCSVVIVTWNRRRELEAALDSVFAQTIAADLEVIVVDNGSNDNTVEWLKKEYPHPVRLYAFADNKGASHGRNAAIRVARAPHVCFLDSDAVIMSENAIERCLEFMAQHPEHRAVAAPIWFDRERKRVFAMGGYLLLETGHFCGPHTRTRTDDPHFLSTCFAVWERSLLEELRGFDPWYFWGIEDLDIGLRASQAGRRGETRAATRFALVPDVHVLHEMASGGRHYQPGDFHAVFHAYERQRLYLVLAYGGLKEFWRVAMTSPFHLHRIERDGWEQPLSARKKLWAFALYPWLRVMKLAADMAGLHRNHLAESPVPQEVR